MTGLTLAPHRRVFAGFCLHAITMGSVFPRMADIKQAMGVEDGTLGLSLIGVPVGTLFALTFATPWVERLGFRRTILAAIPLVAMVYALAVHATRPEIFFVMLLPIGFLIGCNEIVLNVEADRVEALVQRRIMNRAHSFWSFGFFGAGMLGAGLAHLGLSPQAHLALIVPLAVGGVWLFLGGFEPAPPRNVEDHHAERRFAWPSPFILGLVAVAASAMLMEGAGIDWSAIYMRSTFNSGPFLAGFAVAVVALSQALARYFADGYVATHSPKSVARMLSVILILGVTLVFSTLSPGLSLLGFALIGVGTSVMFPLGVSAAAQRTDRPSVANVAAFVQITFIIFLLAPPLLGRIAQHWGIQWAYGVGLPLAVITFLGAGLLGTKADGHTGK